MYWNTRIPRVAAQIRDQAIMVAVETGALQFSKGLARWVVVPGAEDRRVGCRRDAHDLRYGWRDESIRSRLETPKDGPSRKILGKQLVWKSDRVCTWQYRRR